MLKTMTTERVSEDQPQRRFARMMVIFPFLGGTAIGGFGVHRFMTGELMMAGFDFFIAILFYGLTAFTYLTGRETAARFISAAISVMGPLFFINVFDTDGIYWVYSSTIVIFYLVSYRWAITFNVIMLAGVAAIFWNIDTSPVQLYSFLVTIGLINSFSLVFALNEARNKAQLQALSLRVDLTGVGNRRAFIERMGETISVHRRYGLPASLVCLDIDNFKTINDTLGHATGDQAIRGLASHVISMLRESDHLFRIGGDEFVIIADGADHESALQLTEKIRHGVTTQAFVPDQKMTISLGLAVLKDEDTTDSWLARADEALYRAKNAGRNQVHSDQISGATASE